MLQSTHSLLSSSLLYPQRVSQLKRRVDLNSVRAVEFVDESAFDLAHTFQVQTCTTVLVVCVGERGGRELLTPWGYTRGVICGGIMYQCFTASSQALKPCKSKVTIYGLPFDEQI